MKLVVENFGYTAGGWRVDKHPRYLADLTGDGRADIVGFGDGGVWVSFNKGDATFTEPQLAVANFAYTAGGWRVDKHPRYLADLTGDGRADIVGFGDGGVWVSLNNGDGTFANPTMVVANFAYTAGGWRVERHPRYLADLTGDGRADIVGFGDGGVWVSLNNGDGTFAAPTMVVANFAYTAGGWRVERHPRYLADLTGDGRADILGFGDGGVWVSLNNGDGTFANPTMVVANFAYTAGGWRVERHPRYLADLTGDGRADIVGFGDGGVWVSLNNGDGTFAAPTMVVANFAYTAGGWRVERHPRYLADLTGDGRADILGFGDGGVWVSLNNGDGTFANPTMVVANFAYTAGGWRVERHPRYLADLTGDGRADILGFGDGGVWVSLNNGNGTFDQETLFVRRDVWTLQANDPWDPITEAYARAVAVMQARPITDPTSWAYQAAIHATFAAAPPGAVWNDCQHGSWYFFSWHRMYLYYFERIVRAAVLSIGGPEDFALPYWNYDQPFPNNTLPQPFREPTLPDGSPNPLFLPPPRRANSVANGAQLPPAATSSSAAMAMTNFIGPPGPGFGGGILPPTHFAGSAGALEQTPHNVIHVLVGGNQSGQCQGGLMIDPRCAALDPIFWLHHSNVDRLWNQWLALGGGRANPDETAWLDQSFTFRDETGAAVTLTGAEVVDSAAQLQYVYDDQPSAQDLAVSMNGTFPTPRGLPEPPEMVAATEQPVDLVGGARSVQLSVPPSTMPLLTGSLPAGDVSARSARALYLNVEDIEAEQNPGIVYGVYLNMPSDDPGADRARHHVGNVTLFGIEQMNDPDAAHPGVPGLRHTFDITRVVGELSEAGSWDPNDITVTFEPITPIPPPGQEDLTAFAAAGVAEEVPTLPVRVGRVSLFVA